MSATPWLKLLRNIRPLFLVSTLLPVISSAQTQPPLFPTTSFVDLGAQTVMATGDFNGDGQPDLVTIPALNGPLIVSVLLNVGSPAPPSIVTTNLGSNISVNRLLAVDMNNDKKLDLVANASNGTSSGIAVLFGNGDGTFQSPVFYPVAGSGYGVATDLNGDGYPDLAIITAATLTSLKVAVLLNQGSTAPGTLSAPTFYPLSITYAQSGPLNIGAADFNGDGKQDILVGGTNLAVFYGVGDGTLQPQQSPVVPIGLTGGGYFVASDLNHDGVSDVAYIATSTATATQLSLQVLLGHSNGTFTVGSNLPLNLSIAFPIALVPAGTTNNGANVNLAAASDKTSILLGDGNGNFSQGPSYAINGTPFPILNSSGKTDLIFELNSNLLSTVDNKITRLVANGDGTFQGIPSFPVGPFGFTTVDLNGDGLTDILSVDSQNNFITGLGRGDGTFTKINRIGTLPGKLLVTGDFSGDGVPDFVVITPGDGSHYPSSPVVDSALALYWGQGDGSFSGQGPLVDLQVVGALSAIAGDFNGDGTPDIIVAYQNAYNDPTTSQGLVFIPCKGNGIFGPAVPLPAQSLSPLTPLLLAGDLNNDHKLDLLWNGSVYLGKGDGTFQQSTVPLPGPALAVGDLNGDGIPDVVIGASVYAGNGDGTFQSSPLYTATLPSGAKVTLATIADSNADGNPDLLLQYQLTGTGTNTYPAANTYLAAFLGDGKGNFTPDSNSYYAGNFNNVLLGLPGFPPVASMAVLARLNNQAPQLSKDKALDYLTWTNDGATVLFNRTNPAPTAQSPLPSKTGLGGQLTNIAPGRPIDLTALVTGLNPTGSVLLTSNGTALGTAPLLNGYANFSVSFPASGTYTLIATYSGDSNNQPSSSTVSVSAAPLPTTTSVAFSNLTPGTNEQFTLNASVLGNSPTGTITFSLTGGATIGTATLVNGNATFPYAFGAVGNYAITATYSGDIANLPSSSNGSLTVVLPDFYFGSVGTFATIAAGQTATTTFVINSEHGYNGTMSLSCGVLTAGETCRFVPAIANISRGGSLQSTFFITTTARTTANLRGIANPLQAIAWAGVLCLTLCPRRKSRFHLQLLRASLFALLLAVGLFSLSACSSSSPSQNSGSGSGTSGTPAGVQTIVVTASDASGTPSHSINLQLTVQ